MKCLVVFVFLVWLGISDASRDLSLKLQPKRVVSVDGRSRIFKDEVKSAGVGYVYLQPDGTFTVSEKQVNSTWVAKGNYTQRMNETGWAFLEVQTNPKFPDANQSFAAGLIEGYLTSDMLHYYYANMLRGYCDGKEKTCDNIFVYFTENLKWMEELSVRKKKDPYWHQVNLILQQVHGLVEGYNISATEDPSLPHISFADFWWLNSGGDLMALTAALSESEEVRNTPEKFSIRYNGLGKCSALVKMLPNNTELLTAQVTWNEYQSMTRILKKYIFPFQSYEKPSSGLIPGHSQSFSSYPGMVYSGDDFTVISSGLVTLETTIGNDNPALWKFIKPKGQVLEWLRCTIANRLAESGEEWAVMFRQFNSGTYNNQWMIVDYEIFKPGGSIPDGLLWVVEQLPGYTEARDKTHVLRDQSYWPSYNSPYYPKVFNMSGSPAMVEKYGDWFTYEKTPRALIFKRDHGKVTDLDSMMKLMRYNDFTKDPLSACNCTPPFSAENAISARNDLNNPNGVYPFPSLGHRVHGATDAKMTSASLAGQLQFMAVGGPAYDPLPAFQWSKTDFNVSHIGHPDLFQFTPFVTEWNWQLKTQK